MRRIGIAALLALALSAGEAFAQAPQIGSGQVFGNSTAAQRNGRSEAVTAIFDRALSSARGSIIERGASGWGAVGPGTAGQVWISHGAGVDPAYGVLGLAGGGTGCSAASGTCLDNITGFTSTSGYLTRTGAGSYSFSFPSFSQLTGSLACSQEPARTGDTTAPAGSCVNTTVKVNGVAFGASPATDTVPVITAANNAAYTALPNCPTGLLQYTTSTHLFNCGTAGAGNVVSSGTPTAGQIAQWTNSTTIQGVNPSSVQSGVLTPTGTNSATGLMMGMGTTCHITPTFSGRIRFQFTGAIQNPSVSSTANAKAYFGTGTAPTNGAAITGTQVGAPAGGTTPVASGNTSFAVGGVTVTGVVGTAMWFDVALNTNGAGVAFIVAASCDAFEF